VNLDDYEQVMPLHSMMVTLHDFCLVSASMAFDEVMWLTTEWKEKEICTVIICIFPISKGL
jgi:hypothetical protein